MKNRALIAVLREQKRQRRQRILDIQGVSDNDSAIANAYREASKRCEIEAFQRGFDDSLAASESLLSAASSDFLRENLGKIMKGC